MADAIRYAVYVNTWSSGVMQLAEALPRSLLP
jgi:hypothetical protein